MKDILKTIYRTLKKNALTLFLSRKALTKRRIDKLVALHQDIQANILNCQMAMTQNADIIIFEKGTSEVIATVQPDYLFIDGLVVKNRLLHTPKSVILIKEVVKKYVDRVETAEISMAYDPTLLTLRVGEAAEVYKQQEAMNTKAGEEGDEVTFEADFDVNKKLLN